jgi:hypothetical protein
MTRCDGRPKVGGKTSQQNAPRHGLLEMTTSCARSMLMRPPRPLHVLLLLLASSSRARAQQHPPGSGWPAGGAASPAIVSAPLGVSLQGNVESPGDILWYSFEATANRERARPCTRSLCRLMPQPLGRFHVAHRAGLRSRSSCLLAQMRT